MYLFNILGQDISTHWIDCVRIWWKRGAASTHISSYCLGKIVIWLSRYFKIFRVIAQENGNMVIKIFPRTQDLMEERCCLHSVFAPQDLYSRSDIVLPDRATLLSEICMFMLSIFISSAFNVRNIVFPTSDIFHKKVFIKLYVMARWIRVGWDQWYSFKIEKNILQ